jgi:hypothetical protein
MGRSFEIVEYRRRRRSKNATKAIDRKKTAPPTIPPIKRDMNDEKPQVGQKKLTNNFARIASVNVS